MEIQCTVYIDTDKYSGNFEREMCTYLIGYSSEYHGVSVAETVQEELGSAYQWFEDHWDCRGEYDEPQGISTAPGAKQCNSVEIYLDAEPPQHIWSLLVERATQYCKQNKLKLYGMRLEKATIQTVVEDITPK